MSKSEPNTTREPDTKARIAFQGEAGANSHLACSQAFPDYAPVGYATFEDALTAVKSGEAQLAMIPIENSVAGRVADIHHLLPDAGLYIVAEHFLPIRFQLMAPKGAKIGDIKDVYSHVHALGQCRKILRKLGAAAHVAGDTAGAARQVSEWGDLSRAALAPRLAAELYGLKIIAEHVEDSSDNTTRFVVLARDALDPASLAGQTAMTTLIFEVNNVPAALYKALGGFATNGVNIVKLESYLSGAHFEQAQFYAEVEGHPEQRSVQLAFEELGFFSSELKLLGSFPLNPFRRKGWEAPTRPGT